MGLGWIDAGESSVYNSSWPEIRLLLSGVGEWGGGGGVLGGGRGLVGGESSADSASTLLTSRIVYVYFTKCRHAGHSVRADDLEENPLSNHFCMPHYA